MAPAGNRLGSQPICAFVGIRDAARTKAFYADALGLRLVSENGFALVFDANGIMLRATFVSDVAPASHTVLGWNVADVVASVEELGEAGLVFERFPGMSQDALGIWTAPGGTKVAWFKDPEGNILSVQQFPAE